MHLQAIPRPEVGPLHSFLPSTMFFRGCPLEDWGEELRFGLHFLPALQSCPVATTYNPGWPGLWGLWVARQRQKALQLAGAAGLKELCGGLDELHLSFVKHRAEMRWMC